MNSQVNEILNQDNKLQSLLNKASKIASASNMSNKDWNQFKSMMGMIGIKNNPDAMEILTNDIKKELN